MKCENCAHWDPRGSTLREHGYGLCQAETDERFRGSRSLAAENVCRIGRFQKAKPVAIDTPDLFALEPEVPAC